MKTVKGYKILTLVHNVVDSSAKAYYKYTTRIKPTIATDLIKICLLLELILGFFELLIAKRICIGGLGPWKKSPVISLNNFYIKKKISEKILLECLLNSVDILSTISDIFFRIILSWKGLRIWQNSAISANWICMEYDMTSCEKSLYCGISHFLSLPS